MKASTEIPFYNSGGMGCIKIEVKVAGRAIYGDIATFRACYHGECLMRELGALIVSMPPTLVENLIDEGVNAFEVTAPDGTTFEKKDISGETIAFCISEHD